MIHGWSALGGLTMAGWEDELERWLSRSWTGWVIRLGSGCVLCMFRD
jgi:hypothetical protein